MRVQDLPAFCFPGGVKVWISLLIGLSYNIIQAKREKMNLVTGTNRKNCLVNLSYV